MRNGFDIEELKKFQAKMLNIEKDYRTLVCEACAKELAARLLALVIRKTPKDSGTLRRGWTAKTHKDAENGKSIPAKEWAEKLNIKFQNGAYVIDVINPVEYASYVESGHRTADHKGWVNGQFFLKLSEEEIQGKADRIIELKINKVLEGMMNG